MKACGGAEMLLHTFSPLALHEGNIAFRPTD